MEYPVDRHDQAPVAVEDARRQALRALLDAIALAEPLQRELARRHRVSVGDLVALWQLHKQGEVMTSQFGLARGLRRSATTELVDRLEAAGLIERCPHPSDRRARIVRVTDAGRLALTGAELVTDSAIAKRVDRLAPDDQVQLAQLLAVLMRPDEADDEPEGFDP